MKHLGNSGPQASNFKRFFSITRQFCKQNVISRFYPNSIMIKFGQNQDKAKTNSDKSTWTGPM